jgi:hypothetical protein
MDMDIDIPSIEEPVHLEIQKHSSIDGLALKEKTKNPELYSTDILNFNVVENYKELRETISPLMLYILFVSSLVWHPQHVFAFQMYSIFVELLMWFIFCQQIMSYFYLSEFPNLFGMITIFSMWFGAALYALVVFHLKTYKDPEWFWYLLRELQTDSCPVDSKSKPINHRKLSKIAAVVVIVLVVFNVIVCNLGINAPIPSLNLYFRVTPLSQHLGGQIFLGVTIFFPTLISFVPVIIVLMCCTDLRQTYLRLLKKLRGRLPIEFWKSYLKLRNVKIGLVNHILSSYMFGILSIYGILLIFIAFMLTFYPNLDQRLQFCLIAWGILNLQVLLAIVIPIARVNSLDKDLLVDYMIENSIEISSDNHSEFQSILLALLNNEKKVSMGPVIVTWELIFKSVSAFGTIFFLIYNFTATGIMY